jgi:beta-galactosidase
MAPGKIGPRLHSEGMERYRRGFTMKIGTYYYPEQWPREQWERDFDLMARMGMQIVHMGEFAWFQMEPEEGKINLDWLAECVKMAAEREMSVILCTPTAAPPIWLSQKYPQTLPTHWSGPEQRFGGRRHYNPLSPEMHAATRRIVTALADRFSNHPNVIGWQIDNEYCGSFDQHEVTHAAFREWLREKYATIAALNKAWGCQFWNTYYTDFGQILMPPSRTHLNPHQCLDASRFWSQAFARFNRIQAEILKPRIGNRFITTNFMLLHPDADPADMQGDLSLFSWDSYPVRGEEKATDQTFRMADPAELGLVHDQMASYNGRWGLMELQPGQVNWTGVPVLLYPGAVRLWIWTAIAHGAEFVTTYRFRQPRFGGELFHHGLVGPDGVTPSAGGREFEQAAAEMSRLEPAKLAAAAPAPLQTTRRAKAAATVPGAVGLVFDFQQFWYYTTMPQARRWDYAKLLRLWYGALSQLGLEVRILHPQKPLPSELKMIVCPGVQMVDDAFVASMHSYVEGGGNLVLTCRTALMDLNGQLFEGPLAKPILPLIGGTIDAYDGFPDGAMGKVELDDVEYEWGIWGDLLYAEEGTKVLAMYADQFYAEAAAVMQKKHPRGTVTYCGVFGEQGFTSALAAKLAKQFDIPTTPLPLRVQVRRRGAYRICLNYQDTPYELSVPRTANFIVGSKVVEPAGVAVWME